MTTGTRDLHRGYEEAMAVFRRGNYPAAAVRFQRLLEIAPASPVLWTACGAALQLDHRNQQARACYEKALALDPRQLEARSNLGTVLQAAGRIAEAAESFRAALRIDPGHLPSLAGLAASLDWQGRYLEGLELLEPLIAAGTTDAEIVLSRARLLLHSGRCEEGASLLERALARAAEPPSSRQRMHFLLGDLCDALGRFDAAFAHYRRGNELKRPPFDAIAHRRGIDATMAVFTRAALAGLPRATPREPGPVFIVGMPRSGTSLVEQILAAHPAVHAGGELEVVPALAAGQPAGGAPWPSGARHLPAAALEGMAAEFRRIAAAPESGIERVTDKTTGNFLFLGLIELLFPNARIIHCRRDPLDTCLSCYFQNFGGRNLPFSYDLGNLGAYFRDYERLMRHWADVSGLPCREVVYEGLVADPEAGSRAIVEFAGLAWHPRCLSFHEIDRSVATVSHAQVRKPVYATAVGRHRHYDRWLGPLKQALGMPSACEAEAARNDAPPGGTAGPAS